jgi:transposase
MGAQSDELVIRPDLPQTVPECHALILALLERIERLEEVVQKQAEKIEDLERQLKQNSRNSSKPPSTDPLTAPDRPAKERTGRKPGGQPGHEGHKRELLPLEKVDRVEQVWPAACEECGHRLGEETVRIEVGEAVRHQVTEIPPARATVIEFQMHAQCCPKCQHTTTAALPAGTSASSFGPRLQAVASMLSGVFRLSKRSVKCLLSDLFGVEISLGAIIACEQRTSEVLAPPVEELRGYVQEQATVNADETSWRERRQKAWLWVAVTAYATVFMIHARRGTDAARKLLGSFAGILGSDRWCAYANHKLRKRQLCWAHLRRHFEEFSEYKGAPGTIGACLLMLTEQVFRHWHQARDETWSQQKLQKKIRPVKRSIEELLRRGRVCGQRRVEATCNDLLNHAPALWTFLRVQGVEPTNNAAERALRSAVIMRKTSFGTHSEHGSRFIERMLTTVATLRQQNRSVIDYLEEACERTNLNRRPRSLLPPGNIMTTQALAAATKHHHECAA